MFVTRLTRWMPLVEQKLLTLPDNLSSLPAFSGVRVTRYLVLCVCFVDLCLSFCTLSIDHCVLCSLIYWFWLPLWYLQTLFEETSQPPIIIFPWNCNDINTYQCVNQCCKGTLALSHPLLFPPTHLVVRLLVLTAINYFDTNFT
jgi:hypothetical protein